MQIFAATKNTVLLGNSYMYYGLAKPAIAVDMMPYYPTNAGCYCVSFRNCAINAIEKIG